MRIIHEYYNHSRDFPGIRKFLIDIFNKLHSFQYFIPSNIENNKFGPCGTTYKEEDDKNFIRWSIHEDNFQDKVIGLSFINSHGLIVLEIHPDYKKHEKEIIEQLEVIYKNNNIICFLLSENDQDKEKILLSKDYIRIEYDLSFRIRKLEEPIPQIDLPKGFAIRNITGIDDYEKLLTVVGSTFPHCKDNMTIEKIQFLTTAEFYHQDLDLICEAPNGEFSSFITVRFDAISKIAEFEPVGTHPNYRRLNLAKALISEGLKRLQSYEPTLICITQANNDEPADLFYNNLGFKKINIFEMRKGKLRKI